MWRLKLKIKGKKVKVKVKAKGKGDCSWGGGVLQGVNNKPPFLLFVLSRRSQKVTRLRYMASTRNHLVLFYSNRTPWGGGVVEISYFLFTFLSSRNLYFLFTSIEISIYFLFPFETSTFSSLWNNSLLSLHFYFNIYFLFIFVLFYENLYLLFASVWTSLLSFHFSIEISTFFLLFYLNIYFFYIFWLFYWHLISLCFRQQPKKIIPWSIKKPI